MMRSLICVCATLCLALLAGCVVAPAPYSDYGAAVAYPGYVAVPTPPPAPRVEVAGVAPVPGYWWVSGYWSWGGARYLWYPGHWVAPRPGFVWVAPRWQRHGGGWREQPGHWRRR